MDKDEYPIIQLSTSDLSSVLDRIIHQIEICDNKASIVLGVFFAVIAIFGNNGFAETYKRIEAAGSSIRILVVIMVFLIILGIILLIIVLGGFFRCKNKQSQSSCVYFAEIASNKAITTLYADCSENRLKKDLVDSIYKTSKICLNKYRLFNISLILLTIGSLCIFTIILFCG